jgi:hypothetical protein
VPSFCKGGWPIAFHVCEVTIQDQCILRPASESLRLAAVIVLHVVMSLLDSLAYYLYQANGPGELPKILSLLG